MFMENNINIGNYSNYSKFTIVDFIAVQMHQEYTFMLS